MGFKASHRAPRTISEARKQARLGQPDAALETLMRLSQNGNASASASVAELLALRGRWNEMVPFAKDLLAHPDAVYAGNVFFDMCFLIRRAAEELRRPGLIAEAAKLVPGSRQRDKKAYLIDGTPLEREKPAGPTELARYQQAVEDAETDRRFKDKPDARARHIYALAVVFRVHDELVRQWPGKRALLLFDQAIAAARVHAQRGNEDEAWGIIESSVSTWWPVDDAQVAPVILVADPDIHPIMTPERCELVLSTARGPEGA